ncbi:MAG: hypothetical protein LBU37_02760 [Tannerellaceae bacterium]|nr:hypothetical protein [Tannerellaceae bacterium]
MAAKLITDIGNGFQMTYKESYAHPAIDILNPFNYRTRIAYFLNAKGYNTNYVEPINARPLNVPSGTAYSVLFFHFKWGWRDGYQDGWYGVSNSYLQYSENLRKLNVLPK